MPTRPIIAALLLIGAGGASAQSAGIFSGGTPSRAGTPPTQQEPPAHMRERIANQPSADQIPQMSREEITQMLQDRADRFKVSQKEIDMCLKWIGAIKQFKDPESMRVDGSPVAQTDMSGAKTIHMMVNAKNSYGAYAGAKVETCRIGPDGQIDTYARLVNDPRRPR